MSDAHQVYALVGAWDDRHVTSADVRDSERDADYAAHLPEHRIGEFLELIDTRRTNTIEIDRLEPSGDEPTSHGFMYVAWHDE